ncbi:MAG TPA: maleylpyruvate isomerase N-terminal domain-containing protein [Sphingomicrobium sp.]|nr:maleylpyruvate isomerase N-terminal domain-containing protein [Sphingomicrobium sp.]
MTDETTSREAPADVRALLERIEEAWRQLFAVLDDIPEERMSDPGVIGEWSLKDLFGHLAFWDEHAVAEIERALAGLPREDNAWQEMNDTDHAARRDHTLPEQRAAMHQAHAALVERLEGVAGIEAAPIDEAIRVDTYEHYLDHIKDIQSWRQRASV